MGVDVSMTTGSAPAEDLSVLSGLTGITRFAGVAPDGPIPTVEPLSAALVSREKPSVPA
jgi:hypothetical protein